MPAKIVFTEKEKDRICALYAECRSKRRLSEILGYERQTLAKVLRARNVDLAPAWEHNKKPVCPEFFDRITRESAYFLGLFVADGSIVESSHGNSTYFQIGLKAEDGYILERLRDLVAPQHRLIRDRHLLRLHIGDSSLCLYVVQWGVRWKRKSYELGSCVPLFDELRRTGMASHFVRGAIDGDGTICLGSHGSYNPLLSCVGTEPFVKALRTCINEMLQREEAGSLRADRRTSFKDRPGQYLWEVRYTGNGVVKRIGTWLYTDSEDLRLERKFRVYQDVVKRGELLGPSKRRTGHNVTRKSGRDG